MMHFLWLCVKYTLIFFYFFNTELFYIKASVPFKGAQRHFFLVNIFLIKKLYAKKMNSTKKSTKMK